jgi:biopolymer transport protein ExbB/TolQ
LIGWILFATAMVALVVLAILQLISRSKSKLRLNASEESRDAALSLERHANKQRDRYKELYELHLDKNVEFEKQRNTVWDLYRKSGMQSQNAQEMLMRELQTAFHQLNIYRIKVGDSPLKVNGELTQVLGQFAVEHGKERAEELVVE